MEEVLHFLFGVLFVKFYTILRIVEKQILQNAISQMGKHNKFIVQVTDG